MTINLQIKSLQDCKNLSDLKDTLQNTHSYIGKTGGRYCQLTLEPTSDKSNKFPQKIELGSLQTILAKFEELVLSDTSDAWTSVGTIGDIKKCIKSLDAEANNELKHSSWLLQALTEVKHTFGTLDVLHKESKLDSIMAKSIAHFEDEFSKYKNSSQHTAYFKLCNALIREYTDSDSLEWVLKHYDELSQLYADENRYSEAGNACMVAATRLMMLQKPEKALNFYLKALNQYQQSQDAKSAFTCCQDLSRCYLLMKDPEAAKKYERMAKFFSPKI